MIRADSRAAEDALDAMGDRLYMEQVFVDSFLHQRVGVTDDIDVATERDRVKVCGKPSFFRHAEKYTAFFYIFLSRGAGQI